MLMYYARALNSSTACFSASRQVSTPHPSAFSPTRYFHPTSPRFVRLRRQIPPFIPIKMAPPRGRGGRDQPREYRISRELTFILRHAAEKEGINIDRQGYANVGELVSLTGSLSTPDTDESFSCNIENSRA